MKAKLLLVLLFYFLKFIPVATQGQFNQPLNSQTVGLQGAPRSPQISAVQGPGQSVQFRPSPLNQGVPGQSVQFGPNPLNQGVPGQSVQLGPSQLNQGVPVQSVQGLPVQAQATPAQVTFVPSAPAQVVTPQPVPAQVTSAPIPNQAVLVGQPAQVQAVPVPETIAPTTQVVTPVSNLAANNNTVQANQRVQIINVPVQSPCTSFGNCIFSTLGTIIPVIPG